MISFYEVLGVPRTASHAELKEAYHAAVLRAHPDKAPGASSTSDAHPFKFHDIQRAWEVLRDAHLRQVHDQQLMLHDMRQTVNYQDELALEEMDEGEHEGAPAYCYRCRCGDLYILPQADLRAVQGSIGVPCPSCSNFILVTVPELAAAGEEGAEG